MLNQSDQKRDVQGKLIAQARQKKKKRRLPEYFAVYSHVACQGKYECA